MCNVFLGRICTGLWQGEFKNKGWRKTVMWLCGCFLAILLLCICSGTSSQTAACYWSAHPSLKESSTLLKSGENHPSPFLPWNACTSNAAEDLNHPGKHRQPQEPSCSVHIKLTSLLDFLSTVICQLLAHKWETWEWLRKLSLVHIPRVFI